MSDQECGRTLRGSHGVVLEAQDEPEVAEAIDRLVEGGVPVVTYTTDVPASSRCAYVGIDNHGAGVTAAYLMNQWLGPASSDVLITLSRTVFRGEGEREVGFRAALRASGRAIVEVSDSDGIDATNERLVLEALERHPSIEAVYSSAAVIRPRSPRSNDSAGRVVSLSRTTSTPTTGGCCAKAAFPSSCTTICAQTRGSRCG
jgi:ABC-type sugar transport system substrate-binding protein